MKVSNAIKKIVAIGAGATMVGATIMGAMALTLADYPQPFVTDGVYSGKIVVGEHAATADLLGAVDIATSLQRDSSMPATGDITVNGGITEKVPLEGGFQTAFGGTLDQTDIAGMIDTSIDFADDTYQSHEQIYLTNNILMATSGGTGQDEFADKPRITSAIHGLGYEYVFDDNIPTELIGTTGDNDTLKIDFLGKALEVTAYSGGEATIQVANSYYMNAGDTVTVSGKTVKLKSVGDTSAVVDVGGTIKVITTGSTETVNGIKVKVKATFNDEGTTNDFAELEIGDKITDKVTDQKGFELFQEYKSPTSAPWQWMVKDDGGSPAKLMELGVELQNPLTLIDATDDYMDPIAVGEKLAFPNNYVEVDFDSLTQDSYMTVTIKPEQRVLATVPSETIAISTGSEAHGIVFADGKKTDKIWLTQNASNLIGVWYDDTNDGMIWKTDITSDNTTGQVELKYGNSIYEIGADGYGAGAPYALFFNQTTIDMLRFENVTDFKNLGPTKDQDASELLYNGADISGNDYDVLTTWGTIVKKPSSELDANRQTLSIPKDQQKANIIIKSAATRLVSSGNAVSLNPIAVGMAVLDKDATLGSGNLIVVGGPCVNTIAAALMANPTDCTTGFASGKAKIKLYATQNALLVAGMDAQDTVGASRVLANYKDYTLTGDEVEVITTNLGSLTVQAPTTP